jgi:hypothetical protein
MAPTRQLIKAGERPDPDGHLLAMGCRDERLDALEHTLVSLDIDAGGGVRQSFRHGEGGPPATGSRGPQRNSLRVTHCMEALGRRIGDGRSKFGLGLHLTFN